jgi:ABC-2 type transport system permease protein
VNFAKVGAILRREYVESVRKKSFLFGLVATPLLMIAMLYVPLAARRLFADQPLRLAIVDRAGGWAELARDAISERGDRTTIEIAPEPHAPLTALEARVRAGELTGWILFPDDFASTGRFQYSSRGIPEPALLEQITHRIERVVARRRAAAFGLDSTAAEQLLQPIEIKTLQLGSDGEIETDFTRMYLRAVTLVFILFFALMPTGQILMRSVIEEKSNRVIEVLLSSVTPREIMTGKILGLGAVGLTLLGTWAACAVLLSLRAGAAAAGDAAFIDPRLALVFLLYFVPGYFFYAALLAGVGSLCTSEREAQPFLSPISLLLVFPIMIGFVVAQHPDHAAVRALSFIPFFTPSLMLFRHAIQEPPAWETLATWSTLVAAAFAMVVLAGRVFEVGVLMTGKRPTLPELARWLGVREARES